MSKERELIAEHADYVGPRGDRRCTCGWHSGRNGQHSRLSFAAHVVAMLSEHGYSIVPSADVKSVRMVAEYALHLRVNGERAPGGDESWPKFDRFAEAVLRATGPAAAAAEEDQ